MSLEPGLGFYYGSRLLQPVGDKLGLSIDQINYVSCQIAAIFLAVPFRLILHPSKASATTRNVFEFLIGVLLIYFCFGSQVIHLFVQPMLCYAVMIMFPAHVHSLGFIISLGYLAVMHIYRQIYDYGGYTLDVTGPMMITTQKLSDLCFSLHDGMQKKEEDLNPTQLKYAQKEVPSILALMSYIFSFHNVMLGPTSFFKDYQDFISGANIGMGEPSYAMVMLKKIAVIIGCMVVTLQLLPLYPSSVFRDETFLDKAFYYKVWYMLATLSLTRGKYYFAWTLSELTNVAAGFGFSGYKEDGSENWDMIDNADIWGVETCTSMKICMDKWNIRTLIWLRRTVYERAPYMNTAAVFAVSAFWHGFYPGYYVAFFTAGLFIYANRSIRRVIRPFFFSSSPLKFIYDAITFIGTRLCCVYMVVPFVIYELKPTLTFYMSQYFWLHILALLAVFCLPKRPSSRQKSE